MTFPSRWWLGLALLSVGCAAHRAESAFAADFSCPGAKAELTSPEHFRVRGCGQTAAYVCKDECEIQTTDDSKEEVRLASTNPKPTKPAAPVEKTAPGVLVMELVLERRALLRITATPETGESRVQLKLVRQESTKDADACNLDFMLNGQVIETPKSASAREGDVLSHRVQIGRELIGEFEIAEKIGLRACADRWALTRPQVASVRGYMERFRDEMAWTKSPRAAGSPAMVAPSGGWPAWKAPEKPFPAAATGPALDATALFKKLSPSVFKLEAKLADGQSQGSAVAVSTTELVTNCHVIAGALQLTLKQGKREWPASVVRADPAADRCTVTAKGQSFQPVVGVRSYESLEVGEAAFTLGSPVGLDLTLSSGLVSGRRDENDRKYVQTTAPISPGSSGGGLFDARGNLIGVTTSVLVGREHLNQALNFAIPADSFGQAQ
jgi:hypothetical protein